MMKKRKIKKKKQIQGWNLYRDGVSQNFICNFITCREQTRLKYIELWQSKSVSIPLEFGKCFHWLLSRCYTQMRSRGRIYLKNTLKDSSSTVKTLLKKYHIYWKKYNPIPSQKQTKNQEIIYGLCQQLLPEYLKRWDGDFLDKYTFGNDTIKPKNWQPNNITRF